MNSRTNKEYEKVSGAETGNQLGNAPAAMSYKQRGSAFVPGPLFGYVGIITGAGCAWGAIVRIGLSLAALMKSMMMSMLYNPWGEGIYRLQIARSVSGRTTRDQTWYHGVKKSMTCHGTYSGALSHRPDPYHINISRNVKSDSIHPGRE